VRETALQIPGSVKKERWGGAPGAGAETLLQPLEKTTVTQVVPLQPMKVHSGADIHIAAYDGPHTTAVGCTLKEAPDRESPRWSMLLAAATALGEKPMQEQVFWQDL